MSSSQDDLHDAALWRALAHAPDQAAGPDWRVRKAILREAHEAIGAGAPARPTAQTKPWWQRLLGTGANASRRPWNAAFATLLVGVLVTLLWQREPVPGPQLDGEAAVPAAPAQKPAPVAPPAAPQAAQPVPPPPPAPEPEPEPEPEPSAAAVEPVPAPPPAPPRRESRPAPAKDVAPKPPSMDAGPAGAPAVAPPPETPAADAAARFAAPALASRPREASEREAPKRAAAAPSVRTDATEPPTFAALSQWTRLTITERGGASRSIARADGRDLNALLGSAALSAVGPRPLAAAPEWRVTLERGGDVLAVFEIARNQVRWREGTEPAGTGTPSAPALAALREALRAAVQPAPAEAAPRTP